MGTAIDSVFSAEDAEKIQSQSTVLSVVLHVAAADMEKAIPLSKPTKEAEVYDIEDERDWTEGIGTAGVELDLDGLDAADLEAAVAMAQAAPAIERTQPPAIETNSRNSGRQKKMARQIGFGR